MRRRVLLLALGLVLTGCASHPADSTPDVSLHLQQRLDAAFNPGSRGDERPVGARVRYALPDGWDYFMSGCMNSAGFDDFAYDRFYGFTNGTEPASRTGWEGLAWYGCTRQYPIYSTVYASLSDEQLDTLYDYYSGYLVPCLGALGSPVTEMPSREAFADGGEGQPGWWNPYLSVVTPASTADVDLLFARCGPYPDGPR
jgi:hypothetical protein